jgi:hypothetical protein
LELGQDETVARFEAAALGVRQPLLREVEGSELGEGLLEVIQAGLVASREGTDR